jgi:hypothetical protein
MFPNIKGECRFVNIGVSSGRCKFDPFLSSYPFCPVRSPLKTVVSPSVEVISPFRKQIFHYVFSRQASMGTTRGLEENPSVQEKDPSKSNEEDVLLLARRRERRERIGRL